MKTLSLLVICLFLSTAIVYAQENDTEEPSISEQLEKFNVTRTNNSNFTRRLVGAVPGVEGRIIGQEPAGVVAGVEGGIVAQDTPSATITTEPPTNPPPEPGEKAACGPTALLAFALIPPILKRPGA